MFTSISWICIWKWCFVETLWPSDWIYCRSNIFSKGRNCLCQHLILITCYCDAKIAFILDRVFTITGPDWIVIFITFDKNLSSKIQFYAKPFMKLYTKWHMYVSCCWSCSKCMKIVMSDNMWVCPQEHHSKQNTLDNTETIFTFKTVLFDH